MYHSIVIEESLQDKKVLDKHRILRTKIGEDWHLHIIEVINPDEFIKTIQNTMVVERPYYFHVYNDDNFLEVVFKNKIFKLDPNDKNTWLDAQEYGSRKLNIPPEQLDFAPNNFKDEESWYNEK